MYVVCVFVCVALVCFFEFVFVSIFVLFSVCMIEWFSVCVPCVSVCVVVLFVLLCVFVSSYEVMFVCVFVCVCLHLCLLV